MEASLSFVLFSLCLLYGTLVTASFTPSHSVVIHGIRFSLLDDTEPSETALGCQTNGISIPDDSSGWKIASAENVIHRMAVASYPWGTSCLVLENGISLVTQTLEPCGSDNLQISNGKYFVSDCDQKVLLYHTDPVDLAAEIMECSSFSASEGNCNSWVSDTSDIEIAGSIHAHWNEGDAVIVSQSASVSESVSSFLETGFTFSVSSYCLSDEASEQNRHQSEYHVTITLDYKHAGEKSYQVPFEGKICDGKWDTKSIQIMPDTRIKSFSVSFDFLPSGPSNVEWKNMEITSLDNLLENPSFHGDGLAPLKYWNTIGLGYMPDLPRVDDDDESFASSVFLAASRVDEHSNTLQGIYQTISNKWSEDSTATQALYVGAHSKTYELTGTMDDNFGIVLDIEYADGSFCYGQTLQFPTGTANHWIYSDQVFQLAKPIASVNLTVVLRDHTGAAWVDGVYIAAITPRHDLLSCNMGVFGDPRFKTVSQQIYSFQTPGEYTLVTTSDLDIQSRHVPFRGSVGSLVSAIAVKLGTLQVSIQFDEAEAEGWTETNLVTGLPAIYLNGDLYNGNSPIFVPGVISITRSDYVTYIPTVVGDLPSNSSVSNSYTSNSAISSDTVSDSSTSASSVVGTSTSETTDETSDIGILEKKSVRAAQAASGSDSTPAQYGFATSVQASTYYLKFPDGIIEIHVRYLLDDDFDETGEAPTKIAGYLQAIVSLVPSLCATTNGLFGNGAEGTLTSNLGDPVDVVTAQQTNIDEIASTWRVTESNSLFHYENGVSTDDFKPLSNTTAIEHGEYCIYWAVVNCDRQALTTLNDSCIDDVLMMHNNPFIVQNYHSMEARLMLVSMPVQERSGPDSPVYHPNEGTVEESSGLKLTFIISLSVLLIIGAIVLISRRRKRKRVPNRSSTDSEIELEEMLTENERTEMFE